MDEWVLLAAAATRAIAQTPGNTDDVMRVAIDWARRLTGAERGGIAMREGDAVVLRAESGLVAHRVGDRLPLRQSLTGRSVIIARPQQCDDATEDRRVDRRATLASGVRSMLAVPLLHGEQVLGALSVMSPRPSAFSKRHTLALQLATAPIGAMLTLAQTTAALRQAERQAAMATRQKAQFLATVSDELRTPLTTIIGSASLLRDPRGVPLTPEQDADVRGIEEAANRLLRQVEDIIDLTRLKAGDARVQPQVISLRETIEAASADFARTAQAKGLAFDIDVAPELTAEIDPVAGHRLLGALIGNAVRVTEFGGVTVSARAAAAAIEIEVADTGPGISPDALPLIFEELWQGNGTASGQGSLGLGLAIARRLAELHGGTLRVESTPGAGSRFLLRLPHHQ